MNPKQILHLPGELPVEIKSAVIRRLSGFICFSVSSAIFRLIRPASTAADTAAGIYCLSTGDMLLFTVFSALYGSNSRRGSIDMKRALIRALCTVLFSGVILLMAAASPQNGLSLSELHLASQIGFDAAVFPLIKEEARCPLHRLSGYDENSYQIMADGIVISVPWNRSDQVLRSLREKLKQRKYMAFRIEINNALKADRIGIIKGTDRYEILRIMHTNGDDEDVSHEDVIDKLKQWEKQSRFEIVGAENDWVEIEFGTIPQDLKAFTEEVYEFSPDTVDEGTGNLAELVKDILATKRLVLWWD